MLIFDYIFANGGWINMRDAFSFSYGDVNIHCNPFDKSDKYLIFKHWCYPDGMFEEEIMDLIILMYCLNREIALTFQMMHDGYTDDKFADKYKEICPFSNPWRNHSNQTPIFIKPSPVKCWNGIRALGDKFRFVVTGIPYETRREPPMGDTTRLYEPNQIVFARDNKYTVTRKGDFKPLPGTNTVGREPQR
eukprot:UN06677